MINYFSTQSSSTLSLVKDIATVVIALANLSLAFYVFIYQRRKDSKARVEEQNKNLLAATLNEQNIKLQWFKELVIQPRLKYLESFYTELETIKSKIPSNDLTNEQKQSINSFVKIQQRIFRKQYIDLLFTIEPLFAEVTQTEVDALIDSITEAIFNDELKLTNESTFEKYIGSPIAASKNKLIAQIYSYKGSQTSPTTS